jgi:uracil-DNA glycosylase
MSYPDFFRLCPEWTDFFFSFDVETEIISLLEKLNNEEEKYYPEQENIFRCFYLTPFNKTNIVIIGQDPYHNGSATGLCFDVKFGNKINPSLQNIYKELEEEGYYPTKDGNLEHWTKQGILLMNTSLTVLHGSPESHLELWSNFMKKVFKKLSEKEFIIWVVLGKKASEWKDLITNKNHVILETSHPSPFSAYNSNSQKAFMGSNLFKNVNKELYKKGIDNISW